MELTVTKIGNETPTEHMARLGGLAKQIMQGRLKAMCDGLMPIHHALVAVSTQIDAEQSRLLAAHPELIMMAFANQEVK